MLKNPDCKVILKSFGKLIFATALALLLGGCKNARMVDIDITGAKTFNHTGAFEELIFVTDKAPELVLDVKSCNVTILSHDIDEVRIFIKKLNASEDEIKSSNKKLAGKAFEVNQKGNMVLCRSIVSKTAKKDEAKYDLTVTLPKVIDSIQIKADKSGFELRDDLRCNLTIEAGECDVKVSRLVGALDARVDKGNMNISSARLSFAYCIINDGNINVSTELAEEGNYNFETGMGNITLSLPENSKPYIESAGIVDLNQFVKYNTGIPVSLKSRMGRIHIKKIAI